MHIHKQCFFVHALQPETTGSAGSQTSSADDSLQWERTHTRGELCGISVRCCWKRLIIGSGLLLDDLEESLRK